MPLSRHFYSLDEVQAALLYTTSCNTPSDALFWCQELLLSGYIAETISILFQSWLWNTGHMKLEWLITAWNSLASENISEEDILLSAYRLSTIKSNYRDNSLWNILVLTIQNPNEMPDRITKKTPCILPSDNEIEQYFTRAIYQGKARCAWWAAQFIKEDRVWELLEWFIENIYYVYKDKYLVCLEALKNYEQLLGYKSNEYDIIIRCAAILSICITPKQQEYSFSDQVNEIDDDNKKMLDNLNSQIGRKNRRVKKIPDMCLYGITYRGRISWAQNNLIQLYNIEKYLIGCPFWDDIIGNYANISENGIINWISDDKMEEFYNEYFPDDIPDEWSKEDKLKSHGNGIVVPSDKPNIWKYSRIFMSKFTRLAWNTTKIVNKYLETIQIDDCLVERIFEYYKAPAELSYENLKKLQPVHKIKKYT